MDVPVIEDFVYGYVNGIRDWNYANGTNVKIVKAGVGTDQYQAFIDSIR